VRTYEKHDVRAAQEGAYRRDLRFRRRLTGALAVEADDDHSVVVVKQRVAQDSLVASGAASLDLTNPMSRERTRQLRETQVVLEEDGLEVALDVLATRSLGERLVSWSEQASQLVESRKAVVEDAQWRRDLRFCIPREVHPDSLRHRFPSLRRSCVG